MFRLSLRLSVSGQLPVTRLTQLRQELNKSCHVQLIGGVLIKSVEMFVNSSESIIEITKWKRKVQ